MKRLMELLPYALDFRGFFLKFQLFSFKTGCIFPKRVSRKKVFSNFLSLGGSKSSFLSLTGGGRHKTIPGKEAVDAVGMDDAVFLRSIFNMKRRRLITVSGVALFALPTPGASKTGAEDGCTGEEPHALLIFGAKVSAEGYTGCSIRMYA